VGARAAAGLRLPKYVLEINNNNIINIIISNQPIKLNPNIFPKKAEAPSKLLVSIFGLFNT